MKTIHKYGLTIGGLDQQALPAGADIVHVGAQGDRVCLWALVDTDAPPEPRAFVVVATGLPTPERGVHIGSVLMRGGVLVWHVFEIVSCEAREARWG